MDIKITQGDYGFGHNWTLNYYGKDFYLGQDVKFCSRVLGLSPRQVKSDIGSDNLMLISTRKKLAKFIINELGITRKNIKNIKPWELCSQ